MYVKQAAIISPEVVAAFLLLAKSVDLKPGPGGSRITPFKADLSSVPIQEPILRSMFVLLCQSQQLVGHCDPPVPDKRYHIPLQINEGCWYFHNGLWQQLEVGHIYTMDPAEVHGAVNWGTEDRIHLIVDTE